MSGPTPRVVALAFAVPALGLLVSGSLWIAKRRALMRDGVQVFGTVVDMTKSTSKSRDRDGTSVIHTTYSPVVEFVASGEGAEADPSHAKSFRFKGLGSDPPGYKVGERVKVVYLPGDPAGAMIADSGQIWLGPYLVTGLGALFAVVGIGAVVLVSKKG